MPFEQKKPAKIRLHRIDEMRKRDAEVTARRLKVSRVLEHINRDFANETGYIADYSRVGLKRLIANSNGKEFHLDIGVFPYKAHKDGVFTAPVPLGRNADRWDEFVYIHAFGSVNSWVIDKDHPEILEYKKVIRFDTKDSGLRKVRREMNRLIRRGLREKGFHVTPQARLRQAWIIARNSGAIIGGAYGTGAVAYKIAEQFITIPQLPIFPR